MNVCPEFSGLCGSKRMRLTLRLNQNWQAITKQRNAEDSEYWREKTEFSACSVERFRVWKNRMQDRGSA
jgi:hypothetical protein